VHRDPANAPRIRVTIGTGPGQHHLCVRDNGKGIPIEDQERIFEIFQTLGVRSDGRRSSGVGLAIVKKIAETHGGGVQLESGPGAGARFSVTLPAP